MGGERQNLGCWRARGAVLRRAALAVSLALSGAICEASAGEGYALVGGGGGLGGLTGGLAGGLPGGEDESVHGYAGVIYAPAHTLSDTGLVLRGWAKAFKFTYRTDLPDEPDARVSALGYGLHAEAGWQIAGEWGRAALFPGIAWRNHELKPSDPDSGLEKHRIGLSIAADTEWRIGDRFGVMANASYLTGFDDFWVQSRPFVDLGGGWKVGLDFAAQGGPDYDRMRAGLFTSGYELPVTAFGRMFLGAAAGVQSEFDGTNIAPFAGANIGVLF